MTHPIHRKLIPGIEQHMPQVTDRDPILCKLHRFCGKWTIARNHQANSLFSASSAFFGLSNQYSLKSGAISVRTTPSYQLLSNPAKLSPLGRKKLWPI